MNRQDIRTDAPTRACVRPRKVLYLEFILIITQNKSKLQYYDECVVPIQLNGNLVLSCDGSFPKAQTHVSPFSQYLCC